MLPGQCQLLPGPYTNPNGTTGWRAGTEVKVSEGAVPGTAVTGITVSPSNREVAGAKMLTPLPDPANPAGSDAVILGSGETDISFMNSSEPDGTLKVCEAAGTGLPAGSAFTFKISSPTPAGSTTTALVPAGSCTIIANPRTSDGLWLFNSTVTITQVTPAGQPIVPPIMVSPAARELSASGSTVTVAIGSGDVTIATYTNHASSGSSTTGAGSTGSGSIAGGSTAGGSAGAGSSTGSGTQSAQSLALVKGAHLIRRHGRQYLALRVSSSSKQARIEILERNRHGKMVRRFVVTVATNKSLLLLLPANGKVRSAHARLMS